MHRTSPAKVAVGCALPMVAGGLKARRSTIGMPLLIPPWRSRGSHVKPSTVWSKLARAPYPHLNAARPVGGGRQFATLRPHK
jgi:hypothetical protein